MKIIRSYSLIIVFLILSGCIKNDPIDSQIYIAPDELVLNDIETKSIFISVKPAYKYDWNVCSKPSWLDINPSSGTIKDKILELQVIPNSEGLDQGMYPGKIEILTNGAGKAELDVQLYVNAHPIAELSPTEVHFTVDELEKTISLSNNGSGLLHWEFQSMPDWISLNTIYGALDEGKSIQIVASAQRNGLPIGTQTAKAVLKSNSIEGDLSVDFSLEVPAMAIMSTSVPELNFNYFDDNHSFYIRNEGNIPFDWDWDNSSNTFLSANPNSGTLAIGDSVEVTLTVDRTDLITQTYDLDANLNYGQGQSFPLTILINHYKEEKWSIEGRIIDAEFDRINDVIIAVSASPNEIRRFNPADQTFESLALSLTPTCVSVSQDGNYAVVGHNGKVTYVDLNSMETVDVYSVTADVFDIILAPNNWVYVFPNEDQWERIRCIDLSTGMETQHSGNYIREKTKVKLHPSGDYIYGADNGLSPSDFEKYDVSNGPAIYLYDSPYHGDYAFSGDIWISEDGNRLFAKSRNVFNSSVNQTNDLTYNGSLSGTGSIITMDYSSAAKKIYAIFNTGDYWDATPSNIIRKYETDYLGFQGTIELPGFLIPDGSGSGNFYKSLGYYGFFNSDGTKYIVLLKIEEGAGILNEWAIASLDVN